MDRRVPACAGRRSAAARRANLALRAERAANATGAELLGFHRDYAAALKAVEGAAVVLVLDDPQVAVRPGGALIVSARCCRTTREPPYGGGRRAADRERRRGRRDLHEPRGRVQRFLQAKPAPGMAAAELVGR